MSPQLIPTRANFQSGFSKLKNPILLEWLLKILTGASDFQAEYEGSIPFTRSNSRQGMPLA